MTDPKYMRPGLDFATGKLIEECGELLSALGKTIRWGRDSVNPELPPSAQEPNWHWIEREIDDVLGAIANYRNEAGTSIAAIGRDAESVDRYATGYVQGQKDATSQFEWMQDKAWQDAVLMLVHYRAIASRTWLIGHEEGAAKLDEWWTRAQALSETKSVTDIAILSTPPAADQSGVDRIRED